MKIAFATIYDARDVHRGSGSAYYLTREIERQGHTLYYVSPLHIDFPIATRIFRYISKNYLRKRYRSYQDPFSGLRLGKTAAHILNYIDYDILLTNDYALAAYTPTNSPIVLYTDAMFPTDYEAHVNPRLDNLSWFSVRFSQYVTRKGLRAANLCIFPSAAASREAIDGYSIDPEWVSVIPFGANIEDPGDSIAAKRCFVRVQEKESFDLLFIGKDWQGKGGDIAIQATTLLRECGVNAVLHVVGSTPSITLDSAYIRCYGYLDKKKEQDRQRIHLLYSNCDAFLMPSRAEGFGIAYVEAAAYGLPSLAYDTVGVNTAVEHGKTGILLPIGEPGQAFANVILSWYQNPTQYDLLVSGARKHFLNTGNWTVAVRKLLRTIQRELTCTQL